MTIYVVYDPEDDNVMEVFTNQAQAETYCAENRLCLKTCEADHLKVEERADTKIIWKFVIKVDGSAGVWKNPRNIDKRILITCSNQMTFESYQAVHDNGDLIGCIAIDSQITNEADILDIIIEEFAPWLKAD